MSGIFCYIVVAIIVSVRNMQDVTGGNVNSLSKYEEYVVEHEISTTQARNQALTMNIEEMSPPAGCKACTAREKMYCMSSNFINDHCCCDRRYKEHLPFIPHTCFIGVTLCQPVAMDCDEYTRLRKCCCNKLLLESWKQRSSASGFSNDQLLAYIASAITFYLL